MIEKNKIGLIGSGGQADEAESYVIDRDVAFRAVDEDYIDDAISNGKNAIDINNPVREQLETGIVVAIGAPALRRMMLEKWHGERYESIISEHAIVDTTANVGKGCIIAPRAVITTNVEIGAHSIINVAATISHDTKIGEFVTICPGVHIAGNVRIGDGVFVGIGATVSNNISIAPGVVVGAGAVVVKDIETENAVVVGVPATEVSKNEGWLREI